MSPSDEQRRICIEVFEQTGYKIDHDDPLVIAGLFYSGRLKTAIDQHEQRVAEMLSAATLQFDTIKAAVEKHENRVETMLTKAAADFDSRILVATKQTEVELSRALADLALKSASDRKVSERKFVEMITVAKGAALNEVPAIKRDLKTYAEKLASTFTSTGHGSLNISVSVFVASLTLCAVASFLAASIWFNKIDLAAWVYAGMPTVEQAHDAPPQAGNAATGRGKR